MKEKGAINYFSPPYLVLAVLTMSLMFGNQQDQPEHAYFEAIRFYESGEYARALPYFRDALKQAHSFPVNVPQVELKIAYCLFRSNQFSDAIAAFQNDSTKIILIEDYNDFFVAQSMLAIGDTGRVITAFKRFKEVHPQSPLAITADSILANLYFARKDWARALILHQKLLRYRGFDKGELYSRIIQIALASGDTKLLQDNAYELLNKHPFHPASKLAYRELDRFYAKSLYPPGKLRIIFDYLADTSQFDEIDRLLAAQIRIGGETASIRWLKIRKLYLQEQYSETFRVCQEQRNSFKGTRYIRDLDLHIARCYLRLGHVDKAIEAYDKFQKMYPQDSLSPEVVWVIAWLSEDEGQIDKARDYYKRLIVQYPQYQFIPEARFRIGLTYYREEEYEVARMHWMSALGERMDSELRSRYHYWIAKTYTKEHEYVASLKELKEITAAPFDNYYNMKAFLLTKDSMEIRQFVDSLLWEVHHKQVSYIPKYLDYFRRPLLVQEIFGETYAKNELNRLARDVKQPDWEITFAMGEVNERMQNFGRAYRLYRKIFDENFSRKDWREWVFLFKYLYPLYFDGEVNEHARQWNITPASLWAIIKKESAFEPYITSYANAYGLMQIIPPTADRLTGSLGMELNDVRRLYDPNFNILLGSYYLSELLKRYEGNLYYALAAYNAGEHRVDRWRKTLDTEDDDFFMENIQFDQTRDYVRGVMKFYWTYHLLIHPYRVPDDLVPFPERVARQPWFPDSENFK